MIPAMTDSTRIMFLLALLAIYIQSALGDVDVSSSNSTLPQQESTQVISWSASDSGQPPTVYPLTPNVGEGESSVAIGSVKIFGQLVPIDIDNVANITSSDVVYVQCDPNEVVSNISPSLLVDTIFSQTALPKAIILYSLYASHCNITGDLNYTSIFTMTDESESSLVLAKLSETDYYPDVTIEAEANATSTGSTTTSTSTTTPTTAVAMSILYSITGIITLLFLIIIATGAIRAHRHPERYGPRHAVAGRPRQSRAKGLARAMLETIPIVKFGDPEPAKPASTDLEMEASTGDHTTEEPRRADAEVHQPPTTQATEESSREPVPGQTTESGLGPNMQAAPIEVQETTESNALGCSICTEDFNMGEDVRVLPCNHKYHPACIDPWLLNVSGTCPLCRVDLRPVASHTSDQNSEHLPPPLSETEGGDAVPSHRNRMSRYLDLHRLRQAPADERIAALRRMRTEERRRSALSNVDSIEESSRRTRLTDRLRDTFRIRTRPQDATSTHSEEGQGEH